MNNYNHCFKHETLLLEMALEGSYQKKGGFIGNFWDSSGRYAFALSAESAWNNYKLNELQRELDTSGYIDFALYSDLTVRVGPEYAEFQWPNKTRRLASSDFKQIMLSKGKLRFEYRDANRLSGRMKLEFKYSSIPNAQLFLYTLKRLVGVDL